MGTTEEGNVPDKIMFLQLNNRFLYDSPVKNLLAVSGGDTLFRIYIQAHCAALNTNGVIEVPEYIEAARHIIDLTMAGEQDLDMVRTALRYMIRYRLVDCTRRDGTAVKLTSADIKDINVDDIARIEFLLTPEYTRGWAKDTLDRRGKREKKKKEREEAEKAEKLAKADVDRILDAWGKTGFPRVVRMTDVRRKHMAARVKSYGIDQVLEAIAMAGQSSFMHSGSWATIDWLLKNDDNMSKVLEGAYADRPNAQQPAQPGGQPAPVMPAPACDDLSEHGVRACMERFHLIAGNGTYRVDRWRTIRESSGMSPAMVAAIDQKIGN